MRDYLTELFEPNKRSSQPNGYVIPRAIRKSQNSIITRYVHHLHMYFSAQRKFQVQVFINLLYLRSPIHAPTNKIQ